MADEKLNTGTEEQKIPEAPEPAQPEPGDVTISADQIDELMAKKAAGGQG